MSPDARATDRWVLADAFDRAAPTYDAMVALSPGYHDQLASAAEALVERLPRPEPGTDSLVVLDLGCGSGASTRAVLDAWAARGGRGDAITCRASTRPRAWSRRPAPSRGRARSSSSSRMPWRTWSRRGRLDRRRHRRVPPAQRARPRAPRERGGPGAAPGRCVRRARLLRGGQRPRPGDLGGRLPRHHHPAGRGQALRRAAATSTRACATSTRWTPSVTGSSRPASSTSAPLVRRLAGRPRAHRRRVVTVVIPGRRTPRWRPGLDRRAVFHPPPAPAARQGGPDAVLPDPPRRRRGGGSRGSPRRWGWRSAASGHAPRARGGPRRTGALVAGRRRRGAGADEPGVPRVLPAVLQPRGRAARTDPTLERLRPLDDYPLVRAGGGADSFATSRAPRR